MSQTIYCYYLSNKKVRIDMGKSMILNVLSKYGIRPEKITLIKRGSSRSVWEVSEKKGKYALKSVSAEKAQIISNVSLYLSRKGVPVITVLPALNGDFVVQSDKFCFILFPWFEGETIRYDISGTVEKMSVLLAQFHEASRGYAATGKPIKKKRLNLLEEYVDKIEKLDKIYKKLKSRDDPTARVFSHHYFWLRKRCHWVINILPSTSYHNLIALAELDPIVGHGDYSRSNILSDKQGNWKIMDLDTAGIYLPVRDLSRMITRIDNSRYIGNWDSARYQSILQCYRDTRPFSEEEEKLLIVDQCFPHQAIRLIEKNYKGERSRKLLERFERCLAIDKEKIRELSIKELEWSSS